MVYLRYLYGKNFSCCFSTFHLIYNVRDALPEIKFNIKFLAKIITGNLKEQLNKHFVGQAQNYVSDKKVYTQYYSFTTWSKDVIFGNNHRLFTINDPELLNSLSTIFPPPYVVSVDEVAEKLNNLEVTGNSLFLVTMTEVLFLEQEPTRDLKDINELLSQLLSLLPRKVPLQEKSTQGLESCHIFQQVFFFFSFFLIFFLKFFRRLN